MNVKMRFNFFPSFLFETLSKIKFFFLDFNGYYEFSSSISFIRFYFINFIGLFFFISRIERLYQIFSGKKTIEKLLYGFAIFVLTLRTNGRNGGESREGDKK